MFVCVHGYVLNAFITTYHSIINTSTYALHSMNVYIYVFGYHAVFQVVSYNSLFFHQQSHWIGHNYYKRGPKGNDVHKTNVPRMRIEFRDEVRIVVYAQL